MPLSPSTDISTLAARDRILLTAHQLFYRDGIRATGIDLIIKQAGVTKVTFYRHFPSKNALVLAFLEYRHQRWMSWFANSLQKNMAQSNASLAVALPKTLEEWFCDEDFRGCAFINSALEFAEALPEVTTHAAQHKQQMAEEIARYLPGSVPDFMAQAIALLVDGAIVNAQIGGENKQETALLCSALELWLAPRAA